MLTEMAILVKIRSLFVIEDTPPLTKDRGPRPPCSPGQDCQQYELMLSYWSMIISTNQSKAHR